MKTLALVAIGCVLACTEPPNVMASLHETHVYVTDFSRDENPLSEGGEWTDGKSAALDWADVAVDAGVAHGLETGATKFDDSTALLTGAWGPNQSAEARVRSLNPTDAVFEEVELRLRSAFAAHRAVGYEVNFRCSTTANAYAEIVRWDGPLGGFTYLARGRGARFGVANGDLVKATVVGNRITAFINGVAILRAVDGRYSEGNPGLGFYLQGAASRTANREYGFSRFRAVDFTPLGVR